jgi:tRNA dimethylallyltransferase
MKTLYEVIVIFGPTASGKTRTAVETARKLNGEIVSVDSVQVYRRMDIGTAKPSRALRKKVPHHMIDIIDPDQSLNAAEYAGAAFAAILDITARGRMPVLAGGAGLYFKAILEGFFPGGAPDPAVRRDLETLAAEKGRARVHARLAEIDPESARAIHPNNLKRVIRAVEVYETTGLPLSQWKKERPARPLAVREAVYLNPARDELYKGIDARTERMFRKGLVKETQSLLKQYSPDLPSLQSIGYRETVRFLQRKTSLAEAVALVKQHTRNYAKRQITWFNRQSRILFEKPPKILTC